MKNRETIIGLSFLSLLGMLFSCNPGEVNKQGEALFLSKKPRQTGVDFANNLNETETFNIIEYLYYYNGGGVAAGDINGDGLADLYFVSNQGPNRLYLNKGQWKFEDITDKAGVAGKGKWNTGVTMADVNGDGLLDIYVCQVGNYKEAQGHNELFINQGNSTFKEQAAEYGLDFSGFSTQAAFFDYDRDGDLDMYLLNHSVHSADVYGEATLRLKNDDLAGDKLLRNDGTHFSDVTVQAGIYHSKIGYGLGIGIGDMNNDGWPDIYVSNDFHENDYLYYNKGDGTFEEGITHSIGHTSTFSMGSDIADFNNDGRLDLLTLDMKPEDEVVFKSSVGADPYNIFRFKLNYGYHYQFPRNMLQLNRGALTGKGVQFSEVAELAGVDATDWSWTALFCDLDNDGWKDIFISNGIWRRPNDLDYLKYTSNLQIQEKATDLDLASHMPSGQVTNYAFKNNGDLTFSNVSEAWGLNQLGCSNGAAYADLDNDGDLDLVVNNLNAPASLFENQTKTGTNNHHYLKIKLENDRPNRWAIGARVEVYANNRVLIQELYTTRGFQSAVEPVLFFGLGNVNQVDSMLVRWPEGDWQRVDRTAADQMTIIKKGARESPPKYVISEGHEVLFKNISSRAGAGFSHMENEYHDFDKEKLLPHGLSTQGPRLAVADVNNDGRNDVFVTGAADQAGALFLQSAAGGFTRVNDAEFEKDKVFEDVAAVFFDADKDGDQDLYVVAGGGEDSRRALDRLYLNNGRGNFIRTVDAITDRQGNGSCVVAADFDGDGDIDLFVGRRSVPGSYGLSPEALLRINDGKGRFTDMDGQAAPFLQQLGMVTAAAWMPREKMLLVVGEWMPLTFITFQQGKWNLETLPKTEGWWNTVTIADMDNDGDEDLILGNWGLNSSLRASQKEPLKLYVGDFDGNKFMDPLLAYYRQHKLYNFYDKDELFAQLTSVKKRFIDYAPFARSTFQEVFDSGDLEGAIQKDAYQLASCYGENKGNGVFDLSVLPAEAQIAPMFGILADDVNHDGNKDIIAVGNWYDVQPILGRLDASWGCVLLGNGKGNFLGADPLSTGWIIPGQGRDIKKVTSNQVWVSRNNDSIVVMQKIH